MKDPKDMTTDELIASIQKAAARQASPRSCICVECKPPAPVNNC